jgi:hypothetical protein
MPRSTNVAVFSLMVVASALSTGCTPSSNPDTGTGDAQAQDAAPLSDAAPGADGAPTLDAGPSPWLSNSTGFVLTQSGGFVGVIPDAACTAFAMTLSYDATSRRLAQTGCDFEGRRIDVAVLLTPAAAVDLVGHLANLTTIGPTPGQCGQDYPEVTLTVLGSGDTQQAYESDFYSGCSFASADAGAHAYIPFQLLTDFQSYLLAYLTACASIDGGPVETGATCVPDADGGVMVVDAGVDGSVGTSTDGGDGG